MPGKGGKYDWEGKRSGVRKRICRAELSVTANDWKLENGDSLPAALDIEVSVRMSNLKP